MKKDRDGSATSYFEEYHPVLIEMAEQPLASNC